MDVQTFVLGHEAAIRLAFFAGVFAIMGVWEVAAPKRGLALPRSGRWPGNVALTVLDALALRIVFPGAAVGMAVLAEERGWGLLRYFECPEPLAFLLSVLALDLVIYLQHVMFHAVPLLWRLHRVHHADLGFDVTTGTRFHPLEILLSMALKGFMIAALGPPPVAVLVFEVLLNATSMFNHGNVRIPERIDRVLRRFVVTPDMHRVHHSIEEDEANSNFGFNLPWWDRLFGTYREAPRAPHEDLSIGIRGLREPAEVARFSAMLRLPFAGKPSDYVINRRRDV
ncbi:MAG: sterol desaturase family protein [Pseudomonadota bacterium]|nr:sterol desaturase family protein [Gammaproteobacteria bacterium]MDQ3581067.1 sterol desaturase family protein [Pseudomonadota bacterium]